MSRFIAVCALALTAMACGESSGSPPPPCVPGAACVPSTGANACTTYVAQCDATTGAQSCVPSGQLPDGATCGTAKVCLANSCIAACVPGVSCTPASAVEPCKTYASACSDKLTTTTCAVGGNQPDGTSCGSGLVCSAGACQAACVAGLTCTPEGAADQCKVYATTCTSTLAQQACAPVSNQPDGTTCTNGAGASSCQSGTCLGALAAPTLSPTGGSGAPGLTVQLTGPDPSAIIYYTTDGTPPSDEPATRSPTFVGSGTLTLQSSATVQAFAKLGVRKSPTVIGLYTIIFTPPPPPTPPAGIALGSGFTPGSVQLNGVAAVVGSRLVLNPTAEYQVASGFYPKALNVQTFTTDFSFQIVDPQADGLTFTIQGMGPFAMGSEGGGLGYGPDPFDSLRVLSIGRSVAVKFDTFNNEGEGPNSTGVFTNGTVPTIPADDLTPSGINLKSGHVFDVHVVYDGAVLRLTITDKTTSPVATFTKDYPIDIPAFVGGVTGFVGFTAATGLKTASHQVINWTYTNTR